MKKLITILALTACVFVSNAQKAARAARAEAVKSDEVFVSGEYKPSKGTVTTEVGLDGGIGNTGFNLNETKVSGTTRTNLKFRYFYKDNIAFRLGFSTSRTAGDTNITNTTTTSPVPTPVPAFTPSTATFNSSSFFGINLGAEKHFKGSERLSTFVGADVLIGTRSTFKETENKTTVTDSNKTTFKNLNGGTYFGLGLLTGADYYIVKKVYLGVELGISFVRTSVKDVVQTNEITTASGTTTSESTGSVGGSDFEIKTALNGGVRIGYQF